MKKLISYFIKFAVPVNVIIIAVVAFGYFGASNLRSSFFPLTESKIINIQLTYPGASPAEMEEGVVLKIENNLKGLAGLDRVTSVSRENSATITVEVLEDYDTDVILFEVKNAVDRVPSFPTGLEPPVVSKRETTREAISLTISGKEVPLRTLKQMARKVELDLLAKPGISQVDLTGFPLEEIEIAVRENDLRAFNLTFNEVAQAVANTNLLTTGGSIKTDQEEYLIRANNRSYYGNELDGIIVKADANGNKIRLGQIAEVRDKWSENPDRLYYNGNEAIRIQVLCTSSEDLIPTADNVLAYLDQFNQEQENVRLEVISNSSTTLKERTKLLINNGGMGVLLVLIFLSLFLKPRLAFWVAFGLPISFFGMFIFAGMFGVTINVLSLFGMIIVIGILVDDGIVIAENIYHHYEMGKTRVQAAIDGTMEVIPPIVSAILTTVVAFSTFFFIQGRMGNFFSEVSVVVILTLAVSLVEALIILPSHIAHSSALTSAQKTYVFNKYADSFIAWMRDKLYGPYLNFFIKNKILGFAIPLSMLIVTIGALGGGIIKTAFFPSIASDRVSIDLKMPQGTNEQITESYITKIEEATWRINEIYKDKQEGGKSVVENTIRRIGPGTANANLTVNLLPGEERNFPAETIANAISEEVGDLYGVENLSYGSGTNFGGRPISVALVGDNIKELKAAKKTLKQSMQQNTLLRDVTDDDPEGIKEIRIELKESAYNLGLNLNSVMAQVRSGFFGRQVQRFQRGQDEIKVWVRYDISNRQSVQHLDEMRIVTPQGDRIPLAEIATYIVERGEISINHLEGKRQIKIEADLKDRKSSATEVLAIIQENEVKKTLAGYPTVSAIYEGQNREAAKVSASSKVVLPIVLILIYSIIAFTFRSYSQPLLLIIMVPFSLIGVGWGHWLHGFQVNVLSWLGIIALIGIVVNDGLVLITKFNSYLKEGLKFDDALLAAGKSRFRAIFLTSVTTIAGLAPLIFETSRQAQFLIPMAISIAYGIGLATFLTLLMLPLLIGIGNDIKVYFQWFLTGKKPEKEVVERAVKEHQLDQSGEH